MLIRLYVDSLEPSDWSELSSSQMGPMPQMPLRCRHWDQTLHQIDPFMVLGVKLPHATNAQAVSSGVCTVTLPGSEAETYSCKAWMMPGPHQILSCRSHISVG